MNDGLNKLKEIGAQKIHEQTHISRGHIKSILDEDFESMTSVQFLGFISILQREYKTDLSELKSNALEYFSQVEPTSNESKKLFLVPQKKKDSKTTYIIIIVVIFIAVSLFTIISSSVTDTIQDGEIQKVDKLLIEEKKEVVVKPEIVLEVNETVIAENNASIIENNVTEIIEPVKSLKIFPRSKVWIGYIDLQTYKKHQTVFRNELSIDTSKDWIIVFGHGNINVEVDGELKKFKNRKNLRFHYKDGKLTQINYEEFKRLNRGKKW